ncbi:MAG: helix-turn-helix transcriptional regulator [bacterium]|nr:helix-turn-helix transcriptional regulator [bacterium]
MKDRLKQIRLTLGYNQQQFAEKLGVELNTYKGYEYKTKNFPSELLIALANILDVNLNWLLTGKGSMFSAPDFMEIKKEIIKEVSEIFKKRGIV